MNVKNHNMLLLIVLYTTFSINAANRLFLENNYGAEIICKVHNNNKADQSMLMNNQEASIGNGVRVLLGLIPFDPKLTRQWVNSLEIRTSRYMSLSSYTSLDNYLTDAANVLLKCCSMQMNAQICKTGVCNKDAIIVIEPSNIMSQWNISIRWEMPWR